MSAGKYSPFMDGSPELIDFVRDFRADIEGAWSYDTAHPDPCYRPSPQSGAASLGQCGPTSLLLGKALERYLPELDPRIVYGNLMWGDVPIIKGHCWDVVVENGCRKWIDITSDQGRIDKSGPRLAPCYIVSEEWLAARSSRLAWKAEDLWLPAEQRHRYATDPDNQKNEFIPRTNLLEARYNAERIGRLLMTTY